MTVYRYDVTIHLADDPFTTRPQWDRPTDNPVPPECPGPYSTTIGPFRFHTAVLDGEVTSADLRTLRKVFDFGNEDTAAAFDYIDGRTYPHRAVRSISVGDRIELRHVPNPGDLDTGPTGSTVWHVDPVGFHRC